MSQEDDPKTNGDDLSRWEQQTQRTINFILQQQAQFAADIQKMGETNSRTESIIERLATVTLRRFEGVEGEVSNLDRKMEALVDSHIRLADTQKETGERLNTLIDTVERIVSERRNGGKSTTGENGNADL